MYDAFFMGVVGKAIDGTERYNGSVAYSVRERAFMAAYDFEGHITDIPDYPEPGVIFKDITTLLKEPTISKMQALPRLWAPRPAAS